MLGLILLALLAQDPDPKAVAAAELQTMDTAEVARMLWPSMASRITDHSAVRLHYFGPPFPPGSPDPLANVELYTEPEPLPGGLCHREVYHVLAGRSVDGRGFVPVESYMTTTYPVVRRDADCAGAASRTFARFNAGLEDVAVLLERVDDLQSMVRSDPAADVSLVCTSSLRHDPCPADLPRLFAELPLDRIGLISPDEQGHLELVIFDSHYGSLFWSLVLVDGAQPRILIHRAAPAPP
ncbi:hypothetical protein [Brevundimonas sp. A19_0]|uniref:hypothetical protein n=1 Tax=Brevundimonas sp. A19_0 TaxID=2821087 RepID=UPI001AD9AA71|nr:hypothetical protein [Brevundimonas sp. A19_0]MBO9502141.1 hypothetical protein [Brevundimonas sp. A19_0]